MNPYLTWILGVSAGSLLGYLAGLILNFLPLITLIAGAILGSTTAISINLQRRKYRKLEQKFSTGSEQEDENQT